MPSITVKTKKFKQLKHYLETVSLDYNRVFADAGISLEDIEADNDQSQRPASHYARLYRLAVREMQSLKSPLPWAAGVGSEAFELLCHCLISASTLGEALALAQRFDRLLFPMLGYRMRISEDGDRATLSYQIQLNTEDNPLLPPDWSRASFSKTVAHASGLMTWQAMCGWLIGQSLEVDQVNIAAPWLNEDYYTKLSSLFRAPVRFDAPENCFSFDASQLRRPLVQTSDTLQDFLANSLSYLIAIEHSPASTSAAIKSLVRRELSYGMPSIQDLANRMHTSESSLRRRLKREDTSYQTLKDELRCEVAIDKLLNEEIKVADLAEYLGFTEPSSFVRSFKTWTGETPAAYRSRYREAPLDQP